MQIDVNLSYFSKKVVTQFVTTGLTFGVAWVVLRYGLVLNAAESALVTSLIAWVAGAFAGWYVKETTPRVLIPPPTAPRVLSADPPVKP